MTSIETAPDIDKWIEKIRVSLKEDVPFSPAWEADLDCLEDLLSIRAHATDDEETIERIWGRSPA